MTDMRYTDGLIKKGEERKRLTKQLAKLVATVADQIAESVPEGTVVEVDGKELKVRTICSNLDCWGVLTVEDPSEYNDWDGSWRVFNDPNPGASYYLHRDFNTPVENASRSEFLWFANNLPEIVAAFEAAEDKVIEALREGFERLRKLAEAHSPSREG